MTLAYSNRDPIKDPKIKNQVGIIIISFVLLLFAINLIFVLKDLWHEVQLNMKRRYNINKEKLRLKKLKDALS